MSDQSAAATAPDAPPAPETTPAVGPFAHNRDDSGQSMPLMLIVFATLGILVSVLIIQRDQEWDEARRVMVACHEELVRLSKDHREDWESSHLKRLREAEADLQRLRDRSAPKDRIDAADKRRESLANQSYTAPPLSEIVQMLDGGAVAILLEAKTREFRLPELRWFAKGEFTFRTYTPDDNALDSRHDADNRYWYIEVRIPERPKPDDNAAKTDVVVKQPDETLPPEGWGRIYADGTMIGPFPPGTEVPEGHPPFVDDSVPAGPGLRPFPGGPGVPGGNPRGPRDR